MKNRDLDHEAAVRELDGAGAAWLTRVFAWLFFHGVALMAWIEQEARMVRRPWLGGSAEIRNRKSEIGGWPCAGCGAVGPEDAVSQCNAGAVCSAIHARVRFSFGARKS